MPKRRDRQQPSVGGVPHSGGEPLICLAIAFITGPQQSMTVIAATFIPTSHASFNHMEDPTRGYASRAFDGRLGSRA